MLCHWKKKVKKYDVLIYWSHKVHISKFILHIKTRKTNPITTTLAHYTCFHHQDFFPKLTSQLALNNTDWLHIWVTDFEVYCISSWGGMRVQGTSEHQTSAVTDSSHMEQNVASMKRNDKERVRRLNLLLGQSGCLHITELFENTDGFGWDWVNLLF